MSDGHHDLPIVGEVRRAPSTEAVSDHDELGKTDSLTTDQRSILTCSDSATDFFSRP